MLIKAFEQSEVRFVSHPEGKYAFGIVAVDLALHLGSTASGSRFARSVDEDYKGVHNMDTPGGTQQVVVLWEPGVYEVLIKSRHENAKPFRKWLFEEVLPSIRETGMYEVAPATPVVPLLEPVTDETIRTYTDSIRYFEGNDDIQLAQLIKVTFGNRLLQQQQNGQNQQVEVEQYEGAIDVAIRLGFRVPANYEGALGSHVRKTCENFIVGKNKRYSSASAKQVSANMYPAYHPEVEDAVMDYCLKKAFRNNNTRLIA